MARLHANFFNGSKPVSQIEQDIDRYITAHPDGIYDEVLKTDTRWQVFYHLSDMRAGLFGWYDMPKDADVLEIGCGFGALTGVLADRASHVMALDSSLFRARSCLKRWNAKKNLDVYAGELWDIPLSHQFDIITLVDVLPAAARGSTSLKPYADYLIRLLDYLKPQGRMIIAMDNRLGLKFTCGACDPYSEEPFGELSGMVGNGRLFTKAETEEILAMAGFVYWKFYYPLPDYRLPQFIFTDEALPDASIGESMIPYDPVPDMRVLPESSLYRDVVENGLFPAVANSFLIECSMTEDFCPTESASLAFDRLSAYAIATCHEENFIVKKPVSSAAHQGIDELFRNLNELRQRGLDVIPCEMREGKLCMPLLKAPTLTAWLQKCGTEDRAAILSALDRLWADILQSSPPVPDEKNTMKELDPWADWGVILQTAYINMTPDNIFYDKGKLIFFNQGLSRKCCPAHYPMFLAVYESMALLEHLELLDEIKERYGLSPLWDTLEAEEQRSVDKFCRYDAYHRFYDWAEMNPKRMMKNRQILKIVGNELDE